jgi:hypothetical protein
MKGCDRDFKNSGRMPIMSIITSQITPADFKKGLVGE